MDQVIGRGHFCKTSSDRAIVVGSSETCRIPLVRNMLRNRRYYLDHLEHLLDTDFSPDAVGAQIGRLPRRGDLPLCRMRYDSARQQRTGCTLVARVAPRSPEPSKRSLSGSEHPE